MTPYLRAFPALMFGLCAAGPSFAGDAAVRTVREASRVETINAKVDAVDLANRTVVLRQPSGQTISLKAGDRVKNLPQVKVGDEVVAKYHESLALKVRKAPSEASATLLGSTSSAKLGEKPAGHGVRQITVLAPIVAIDTAKPSVTLRGVDGNLVEAAVRDRNNLRDVSVGDTVEITYTEALAISVSAPRQAAAQDKKMTTRDLNRAELSRLRGG